MSTMKPAERLAVLRRAALFRTTPQRDLEALAAMMDVERYPAGQTVCAIGDVAAEVFVVASGTLKVQVPGEAQARARLVEGDVFGELAMFADHRRSATVVTETEVVLLSLGYESFRAFLVQFGAAAVAMLEIVVRRFLAREHH